MKNTVGCILVLFSFYSSTLLAEVQYFKIGPGHVVAYEYQKAQENFPTLILLPGVNRALGIKEKSVQRLIKKGWGVLLPSLSAQPLSIAGLDESETPYFLLDSSLQVQSFAQDINELNQHLQITSAIPVSLSYTSSLAMYLDSEQFPHVIHAVPMIEANEGNPMAAQQAALWESWFSLNPFMAPFWIRNFRDTSYRMHWGDIVDSNLRNDPGMYGANPRTSDIKEGYVAITRAAEEFDLREWDFAQDDRSFDFILVGQESAQRLSNQIEMIRGYLASGKSVRVVVIRDSGHVLPTDNPTLYAEVVSLLASTPSSDGGVLFTEVINLESLRQIQWQGQQALEEWLNHNH